MASLQSAPIDHPSLTTPELLSISLTISREFSPRIISRSNRLRFSAQELLAISQEIFREFSQRHLPNSNKLVLLPVDPHHLHVYWQLADPKTASATDTEPQPLALRLYPEPTDNAISETEFPQPVLDITISAQQHSLEIRLPDHCPGNCVYQAAIGRLDSSTQKFTAYAQSNSAALPAAAATESQASVASPISQFMLPASASSPTSTEFTLK
jgi:hypothetical protein